MEPTIGEIKAAIDQMGYASENVNPATPVNFHTFMLMLNLLHKLAEYVERLENRK
jgi:hypothetical protein